MIIRCNCSKNILPKWVKCKNLYEESYKEVFNVFKPKSYLLSSKNNLDNIVHIRFGDKFLNEATASKMDNRSGDPGTVKKELLNVYEKFGKRILSKQTPEYQACILILWE